jgi:secondary thiamine-phosphate synthase enzyme
VFGEKTMITISVPTSQREQLVDITAAVRDAVAELGCETGICHVHTAHTTAGLTINENADPDVVRDILLSLDTIVQDLRGFRHAEGNSTAHVKSSLTGNAITVPVKDGRLVLGTWQGIYFCEFDGPRTRRVWVTCTPAV